MEIKDLIMVARNCQEQLINALTEYVREHGEEMSDYFYNEFGMYEEDEEGVKITHVLDTSDIGCSFARQFNVNDDNLKDIDRRDEGFEIFDKLEESFHYATYLAFYIVKDADGNEDLKYYCFYNDGVCYQEDSEPDHNSVESLSLDELRYIYEAIIKSE